MRLKSPSSLEGLDIIIDYKWHYHFESKISGSFAARRLFFIGLIKEIKKAESKFGLFVVGFKELLIYRHHHRHQKTMDFQNQRVLPSVWNG